MKKINTFIIVAIFISTSLIYSQGVEDYIGMWEYVSSIGIIDIKIKSDGDFWFDGGSSFTTGSWALNDSKDLILYFNNYPPEKFSLTEFSQLYWIGRDLYFDYLGNNSNKIAERREEIRKKKKIIEQEKKKKKELEKIENEKERIRKEIESEQKRIDLINSYLGNGDNYFYQKSFDLALSNYESALDLDFEYSIDKCRDRLISCYVTIADSLFNSSNYTSALDYYMKANNNSITGNEYYNQVKLCDIKIGEGLIRQGDEQYIYKNYNEAINKYSEAYYLFENYDDNANLINLKKKYALCYEKTGDNFFNKENYYNAISNYKVSLDNNSSSRVKKKLADSKDKVELLEQLSYKVEAQIGIYSYLNPMSDTKFDEIYNNSFGVNLSMLYKFNQFICMGINFSTNSYICKNLRLLVTAENMDTNGFDGSGGFSDNGNLQLWNVNTFVALGYFIYSVNPYVIIQIGTTSKSISNIGYYLRDTTSVYYKEINKSLNSPSLSYLFVVGVRVGSKKFKVDLNIQRYSVSGEGILKGFKSLKLGLGMLIAF